MRIKDCFISSETNNYRPWIITPPALALFCLVIWGLRFLVPAGIGRAEGSIDAVELMAKVNLERTQRFIPSLMTNSRLTTAASAKSHDMLSRSYFAHVDPDGNYVWPRIENAGYSPYLTLGENLAMDFNSAQGVVDAWMNSPTHRANIVNEKFQDQGLAAIAGAYEPNHDTVMVVSLFGALYQTPKPTPPKTSQPTAAPTSSAPKPAQSAPKTIAKAPISAPPATLPKVSISNDAKIDAVSVSDKRLVNLNIVVSGSPTLVTAQLKTQSITLLPGKVQGEYLGVFTFKADEDLAGQIVNVEARDKAGSKTKQSFPLKLAAAEETLNASGPLAGADQTRQIPITNEAEIIKILRIVFGIFAACYLGFLIIDAIIIHRAKVRREGIQPDTHILLFFLVASVTLFSNWF
ncbi:MAG: hypothetical protein A3J07_01535 [Candidatus Doudnabacteria bacterium RIFCSPLOWO2_02_FULL_49_13]|uniref:SCP domain-containing protein n=1 Tax=Candidatus Doudnabacteria bacterium RIFCSPHIGHO2_12_FULL_48_16 TaxID=1817838 RepID=A0A1F5PKZ1_9BACT|nr:MAG: hypothetical protein A3B77_01180 [Candidatus Doudnabacteria bacterium RIFCSPHIGHO2_02_FULL_49_24]OGE88855.1 MAG: hypothetical protein A2760_01535 [Candidatus Doudnabacteria bacterium RIFCSPHIGHO2_01_FULL_50_67]OGE90625.1 MAG: hypothetical protein A3E29_00630 [Candidatus Doudnabacteria bacterium RIFCSPHIGHO2_12_FULL_48_16]OGE96956.1 MAG: hypothetical protein A2990_02660 [Candidatus Doudnabacteria bacterium RIFCSPLOWO2_01_FULL_49_40]OGF02490.1 MAG: hypothetical protein A3J07_01535 [Candid